MLNFKKTGIGNYVCTLNLKSLYPDNQDLYNFNKRWKDFYASDKINPRIIARGKNIITYPHKSWIPNKKDKRIPVLFLFGNPATHSIYKDVYFAYEGKGKEHRFWKVFRELGFVDLKGTDINIKNKFLNLKYDSPFRLGFEVIYTFPSTASKPKWSGVSGLERLFGKRTINKILEFEKARLRSTIDSFLKNGGVIIAMQKDAYNSVGNNKYNLNLAVNGKLVSDYNDQVKIYGTPPTRWLHTKKMKRLLLSIKNELVQKNHFADKNPT